MESSAPLDRAEILTPAWLTKALSVKWPGVEVATVRSVETIQTQATKIRFEVTYTKAPAGTPTAFCVKGVLAEQGVRLLASRAAESEARFYDELQTTLTVQTPPLVYAAVDPENHHGLIVMEDVVAAGGTFLTALNAYSVAQAASTLDQLARLHAASWNGKGIPSWIGSWLGRVAQTPLLPVETLQALMDGERTQPLPIALRSAERLHAGIRALATRTSTLPECLVHGDCHAGNVFETTAGPGLVDWQMLQRGSWALDAAYHVSAVLAPEVRRAHEKELLRGYLASLAKHGATPPPDWETAWTEYRASVLWGYYLWCVTRMVEPAITHEFVRRLGLAVADLGTYELLGISTGK